MAKVGASEPGTRTGSTGGGSTSPPKQTTPPPAPPPPSTTLPPSTGGSSGPPASFNLDPTGVVPLVNDLIDSLQKPPSQLTQDYVMKLARASAWLGTKAAGAEELFTQTGAQGLGAGAFPEVGNPGLVAGDVVSGGLDSSEKIKNGASRLRNDIFLTLNMVNAFVARAKNEGFAPAKNPFARLMSYNNGRTGFSPVNVANSDATQILSDIVTYLYLLSADRHGALDLSKHTFNAVQISSANFSMDGFGGTGDSLIDLKKLLPDGDFIKTQKAQEALAVFDFAKRNPRMMFTAFYQPDGIPSGVIVGWRKMPDASGYIVKRHDVIHGKDVTFMLTNDDVRKSTRELDQYVRAWILSFYDKTDPNLVFAYLDKNVVMHTYYLYTITAYQLQIDSPGGIFSVDTRPAVLGEAQVLEMKKQLKQLQEGDQNTISPYPLLAHFLLGKSEYDWILAGVNTRESINRGDPRSTTRKFSYLGGEFDFLLSEIKAGRFVIPRRDIRAVSNNVATSLSKYGVSQVVREVLQDTGALFYFDGKDASDNAFFKSFNNADVKNSGLINVVAAAVDPETATLNLRSLVGNLPILLSGEFVSVDDQLGIDRLAGNSNGSSTEIQVDDQVINDSDKTNQQTSEDEIQFFRKLGSTDGIADLTTVDGIGLFMRAIRIFSDIGPGKGVPFVQTAKTVVPDPVDPPPAQTRNTNTGMPVTQLGKPPEQSDEEDVEPITQGQTNAETRRESGNTGKNKNNE